MIYRVILGILYAAVTFVMLIIGIIGSVNDSKACKGAGYTVATIAAILFLCIPFSFRQVEAGEVAVVKHMGQVSNVREAGTYFDFWMTDSYTKYDAKVQNVDITTQAYSKDAQTMDISMTVQFQIQTDKVREIAIQYGGLDALENKIQNVVIERTKSVLSKYSAMEIIETRGEISPEVESVIKSAIDNSYYVSINTAVLSNIDFSEVFEKTVEDKMVAEQEKLKAEYEKEKAIIEAEKELEVAKLAAQARIAAAEGDAEAQKISANAAAYEASIKVVELARTLGYPTTEQEIEDGVQYVINWGDDELGKNIILSYIQYLEYLSKWNGELPDVISGDSATILIPKP